MRKLIVSRFVFAALCGAGFTALVSLLLNFPYVNILASFFVIPGGIISSVLFKATDSPPLILAGNLVVYSVLALAGTFGVGPNHAWQRAIPWLAVPVGVLICLASIPVLDPLWPVGMSKMAKKEVQLQAELPLGADLNQARQVLHS
jgi:hypothetical protein